MPIVRSVVERVTRRYFIASVLLAAAAACHSVISAEGLELDTLAAWMSGSFSTTQSGSGDERGRLLLHASPVWTERSDGRWLYVERAYEAKPSEPYWQRIVHMHAQHGEIVSDTYMLPGDPHRFAGAWREPALLSDLDPARLPLREGCSLHWSREADGAFSGSTRAGDCPSKLRGAHHAMSTLTVTEELVQSWDRGFDESGRQVWGRVDGPVVFVRDAGEETSSPPR
jgi:hypothetical protein